MGRGAVTAFGACGALAFLFLVWRKGDVREATSFSESAWGKEHCYHYFLSVVCIKGAIWVYIEWRYEVLTEKDVG